MTAQFLTILSGVLLLLVFALVGWNQRRRRRDSGAASRRETRG